VSIVDILIIFVSIVVTSFISGLLSLGGGTILMGVFVWIMPVALAMMLHGLTQFVSNGSRAVVYWKHIRWPLISGYVIGALAITGIFSLIAYVPDKAVVFLLCGTLPFANYVIPKGYALDVTKRGQSVTCGFVNTGVMLTSGVSGPVLDVFFNKTDLTRFQIMGTKGLIQSLAHCLKVIYFGGIILATTGEFDMGIPLVGRKPPGVQIRQQDERSAISQICAVHDFGDRSDLLRSWRHAADRRLG